MQMMMKFKTIATFIALILIWSCSERSPDDITNPQPDGGFTELKGNLSGTLPRDQSPYLVTETIVVDSMASLIIEKGVQLHFTDSTRFIIYGRLEAVGDSNFVISFTANRSTWKGISVIDSDRDSEFRFCLIEKVLIDWQDSTQFGALEVNNSSVIVQNCVFQLNSCYYGGGLSLLNDAANILNNIIRENHAVVFGGGIFALESSAQIINNTFYRNYCENLGGGLVLWNPVAMDIQNNIFFENIGSTGDPRILLASGNSSGFNQQYNFLPGQNDDPYFISHVNLHLQIFSPCIDAGNPDSIYYDVDGTRNDQGAYGGPGGDW